MAKDTRIEDQPAPLHSLIAAPLEALQAAQSIAQIEAVQRHLEAGIDEKGRAKVLRIEFPHHAPDPTNVGTTEEVPGVLEIPLLSLMKIPALEVAEAEIEFSVNLKSLPRDIGKTPAVVSGGKVLPTKREAVQAAYARPSGTSTAGPAVHFKLKLKGTQQREGAAQLERTLTDSIRAFVRPVTKEEP